MKEQITVVGMGYVGLPLALALARKFPGAKGFDINESKLGALRAGKDFTAEVTAEELSQTTLRFTSNIAELASSTFFIVAVPTPVDKQNRPDLRAVISASETVGRALRPGAVVVYESTVYPGVTEDICGPVLAKVSGLKRGVDFKLGYSPERINPGDKEHTLARITKVVAGEDAPTLARVAAVYRAVVEAGIHCAPSIKVAEAAKVIENTQRDLNIALMNELAMIFERMNIQMRDVLAAARTKWNFLPFTPGLVGGHCIGVDPYYLTSKAEELGYHPQVILAGRRINDGMGAYIAQKTVKLLSRAGLGVKGARVGILGLTFKENVPDLRNSRVPDIIAELQQFGIESRVTDACASTAEAYEEYGLRMTTLEEFQELDALIFAVAHRAYLKWSATEWAARIRRGGVLVDVKSVLEPATLRSDITYWSL